MRSEDRSRAGAPHRSVQPSLGGNGSPDSGGSASSFSIGSGTDPARGSAGGYGAAFGIRGAP